jgi:hypothetical protein
LFASRCGERRLDEVTAPADEHLSDESATTRVLTVTANARVSLHRATTTLPGSSTSILSLPPMRAVFCVLKLPVRTSHESAVEAANVLACLEGQSVGSSATIRELSDSGASLEVCKHVLGELADNGFVRPRSRKTPGHFDTFEAHLDTFGFDSSVAACSSPS